MSTAHPSLQATSDIRWLTNTIRAAILEQGKDRLAMAFGPEDINPDKFNRIEVNLAKAQRRYTISVFQPSTPEQDPTLGDIAEPDAPEPKPFNSADRFGNDFRGTNPKLHQLYVANAREAIRLTRSFCEAMWERSRWPDSEIASAAWKAVAEHSKTDAAWFEAAALEFLHQEEDVPLFPRIDVDMSDLPPGEYTGHLEERDGILVFVVNPPETPVD